MDRKFNEADLIFIDQVLGYDVYIPQVYNNPLSRLNVNCPIWVRIPNSDDCKVFILQSLDWRGETESFISNNFNV